MSKCPACEQNIPAYKTVVGDVKLLCQHHKDGLDGKIMQIVATPQPNTVQEIQVILDTTIGHSVCGDETEATCKLAQATQAIKDYILKEIIDTKVDFSLLGCSKHWSDDSEGTCTCDENQRTALSAVKQLQSAQRAKLGVTK